MGGSFRWLLTRSNTCERKVFLSSYLQSDIFGLRKKLNNHMVELISQQGKVGLHGVESYLGYCISFPTGQGSSY